MIAKAYYIFKNILTRTVIQIELNCRTCWRIKFIFHCADPGTWPCCKLFMSDWDSGARTGGIPEKKKPRGKHLLRACLGFPGVTGLCETWKVACCSLGLWLGWISTLKLSDHSETETHSGGTDSMQRTVHMAEGRRRPGSEQGAGTSGTKRGSRKVEGKCSLGREASCLRDCVCLFLDHSLSYPHLSGGPQRISHWRISLMPLNWEGDEWKE